MKQEKEPVKGLRGAHRKGGRNAKPTTGNRPDVDESKAYSSERRRKSRKFIA